MKFLIQNPKQALNKAYLKEPTKDAPFQIFKKSLHDFLNTINEKESEEHQKNDLSDFLKAAYYRDMYAINTKGRDDLVIHNGKTTAESVGVVFENKKVNATDMVTVEKPNVKSFQQLIFYYFNEKIDHKNNDIKHLIITDSFKWFIFDENDFEKAFFRDTKLLKGYETYKQSGKDTKFFYETIAKPRLDELDIELKCTCFDLRDFKAPLSALNTKNDLESNKKLTALFKILSPTHLLKLPFANDSNQLDKSFYAELLHIIGLEEVKDGSKKLINRKAEGKRNNASLLENTLFNLEGRDLSRVRDLSKYGDNAKDRLYNIALELCITWVNRILFLKLLEAQLIKYHKGQTDFLFLNKSKVPDFDELNKLFFKVLAEQTTNRRADIKAKFSLVPYLNSSLFERTDLESDTIDVSNLDDSIELPYLSATVLKNDNGKRIAGNLRTLHYFFEFLNAYNFASEGDGEIQEKDKTLINAAVLGLIFEKINGYKDGSFFTPSFVTMYMCRESIRRAVLQKFNDRYNWTINDLSELSDRLDYHKPDVRRTANDLINDLKICDPAVGSGHFLVSALNEIIAIKSELNILSYRNGDRVKGYQVTVENDELTVTDEETGDIFAYVVNEKNNATKEVQQLQETLFHEKQTIIENCLFGVDINPNSVKICRLRLWIELLKNAYYAPPPPRRGEFVTSQTSFVESQTPQIHRTPFVESQTPPFGGSGGLETLPNIDINIKEGNSLISRFKLDEDLKDVFKKTSRKDYLQAVQNYKNAPNKEEKEKLKLFIKSVKDTIGATVFNRNPIVKELSRIRGTLFNLDNQIDMFGNKDTGKDSNAAQKQQFQLLLAKKEKELEDYKTSPMYQNSFEWRFEFPEVLDNEGVFVGFDVVIGNPPYLTGNAVGNVNFFKSNYKTAQYQLDLYVLFMEQGINLLKSKGLMSYITPNSWLKNLMMSNIRLFMLKNLGFTSINPNIANVFAEAQVDTMIFIGQKTVANNEFLKIIEFKNEHILIKREVEQARFLENDNYVFDVEVDDEIGSILKKIKNGSVNLEQNFDIVRGINPYDALRGQSKETIENKLYHADFKKDDTFVPEIRGRHVSRYSYKWNEKFYISYGSWLAAPREERYFKGKRLVLREILGETFVCTMISEDLKIDRSLYIALPKLESVNVEHVLGILASRMLAWFFRYEKNEFDKLFPKIRLEEFKKLPIKIGTIDKQKEISDLVSEILTIKQLTPSVSTADLECEIDRLVYGLYDLTVDEIAVIEGSVK